MRNDPSEDIRPWPEIVDEVRGETKTSLDDLAYEARFHGAPKSLTGSGISQIKNGKRPYSTGFFEGIAGALGISPFRFGEYHLALARTLIDERQVGLNTALENLDRLPDLVSEASEEWPTGVGILEETEAQISRALDRPDVAPAATGTEGQAGHRKRGRA